MATPKHLPDFGVEGYGTKRNFAIDEAVGTFSIEIDMQYRKSDKLFRVLAYPTFDKLTGEHPKNYGYWQLSNVGFGEVYGKLDKDNGPSKEIEAFPREVAEAMAEAAKEYMQDGDAALINYDTKAHSTHLHPKWMNLVIPGEKPLDYETVAEFKEKSEDAIRDGLKELVSCFSEFKSYGQLKL